MLDTRGIPPPPVLSAALHDGPPVTPRPSASVIVFRGRVDWELRMMRRPGGADFAPGAWVFPGGSVHPEDGDFPDPIRAAAVRELFEELGILLARRADGRFARDDDAGRLRARLEGGSGWRGALAETGLRPAFDRLASFQRWITPVPLRRRFDARFYVAKLPAGQVEHPQAGEVVDWRWITPAGAARELELVPATRHILETLATEPDAPRMVRKLRRRRARHAVLPRLEFEEQGFHIVHETIELPDRVGV